MDSSKSWDIDDNFIIFSKPLGYKPQPNFCATAVHTANGKLVYRAEYTIDKYSRRVTPQKNINARNKFIVFFGCSFTFGEGLQDNETMPFYVSQYASRYRAYNYGFFGYGPQQMLAHLARDDLSGEIQEKSGVAVYTFIDDHIKRAVGSMHVCNSWGKDMPFYTVDSNGRLIRKGTFYRDRPILTRLYLFLGKRQFVKYFNLGFPRISRVHLKLVVQMIRKSRDIFLEKYPDSEFIVIVFPGSHYGKMILRDLNKYEIKYFDYSSLLDMSAPGYTIDGQGHPRTHVYRAVAERFAKDAGIYDGY